MWSARKTRPKIGKYSSSTASSAPCSRKAWARTSATRNALLNLLRFASHHHDTANVGLADYKARMKEGQEAIYYITADTLAAAKNSPQLEVFKKKGIEVLLMTTAWTSGR